MRASDALAAIAGLVAGAGYLYAAAWVYRREYGQWPWDET